MGFGIVYIRERPEIKSEECIMHCLVSSPEAIRVSPRLVPDLAKKFSI